MLDPRRTSARLHRAPHHLTAPGGARRFVVEGLSDKQVAGPFQTLREDNREFAGSWGNVVGADRSHFSALTAMPSG